MYFDKSDMGAYTADFNVRDGSLSSSSCDSEKVRYSKTLSSTAAWFMWSSQPYWQMVRCCNLKEVSRVRQADKV